MEMSHVQDPPREGQGTGYYNDLLNRVDSTIETSRSAYGSPPDYNPQYHNPRSGYMDQGKGLNDVSAAVLFGDGDLDGEAKATIVGLYCLSCAAFAFSFAQTEMNWFVEWMLNVFLSHLLTVALRMGLVRVDPLDKRRTAAAGVGICLFIWMVSVMATSTQNQIGAGFAQFFCTLILGAIVVEVAFRLYLHFLANEQRRLMTRPPPDGPDSEDLQYAAL